ncbi:MAG TPA: PsbP-related protein [Candidatus Limnocylindrales bacterium]|nr:PsbP-related protein [Candidatus Limnocylindrales bacterium]
MENTEHSNRKTILIAAAAIVVTLLFLMIAIFTMSISNKSASSKDSKKSASEELTPENPEQPNQQSDASEVPSVSNGWKTYKNEQFSINYPQDWETNELNFPNGKPAISIKPTVNTSNSSNVILTINIESAAFIDSFKQRQQGYAALGFKNSKMQIDNIEAYKLRGSLAPKTASASASAKAIQTTYILLKKGDEGYVFDYSYTSSGIDAQLEKIFNRIISSFKFIQ